jgi:type IV protein arginine methyltransferase
LKQFHEHVPNLLLDASSTYSYFNGLAGTNPFFHEVYNQVARADLWGMGVSTEYVELNVGELGDEIWVGTARAYYSLEGYQLPICKLSQD